jgi:hypothetical protein
VSKDFRPVRIVSILTRNWYNTVTSIDSIIELLRAHEAELPTRALLLCDDVEENKIQSDDVISRIEAMGLEAKIRRIPVMNDILKEPFPYSPEDGDVINSRPGSGTHLGLMINSLTESLKGRSSIRFYLSDIRANGTSMVFSRVSLESEVGDTRITSKNYEFESRDFLKGILEDSGVKEKKSVIRRTKAEGAELRIFKIHENHAGDDEGADVISNLERASTMKGLNTETNHGVRGTKIGKAFEELVGYEMAHCDNITEFFVNVEWPQEAKWKGGPKKGETKEAREDDCVALTSKGNIVCFSVKHKARDNRDQKRMKDNAEYIRKEIEKLESFKLPGNYPRQRVFNVLVTTTPQVNRLVKKPPDVIVTNLFELCQNISHL